VSNHIGHFRALEASAAGGEVALDSLSPITSDTFVTAMQTSPPQGVLNRGVDDRIGQSGAGCCLEAVAHLFGPKVVNDIGRSGPDDGCPQRVGIDRAS